MDPTVENLVKKAEALDQLSGELQVLIDGELQDLCRLKTAVMEAAAVLGRTGLGPLCSVADVIDAFENGALTLNREY